MSKFYVLALLFLIYAFHAQGQRLYVNLNATGSNDGTSWANAYADFQTAIDAATSGDSIFVAQATYLSASGIGFVMKEGVKIFGGFLGAETSFSQRNLANKATLQGNGHRVIVNGYNGLTASAVLDGFIITGSIFSAMSNFESSPTIANCVFSGNFAGDGGGIINVSSSPIITNCTFSGNTGINGAAIHNQSSNPTITNCIFSGNTTIGGGGGGVYNLLSSPTIANCLFWDNHASGASTDGGAMINDSSSPNIVNCTFWSNTATRSGGGMANINGSNPTITNCIIGSNTAGMTDPGIFNNANSIPVISYSDVQGGLAPGIGNIYADPLFTDAANGNFTLKTSSPCKNTGNSAANATATDLAGNPRISGFAIDMGAYELQSAATFPIPWPVNQQITKLVETNSAMTFDENCNLLAALQSMGDSPVTGEVTAKVWIEDSQPAHYVRRHYEITPADGAATATGKVTLYFTQEDFNAFNLVNPTTPLPGNLLIEKRTGTSSDNTGLPKTYPGTPETLSDVETVWNGTAQRWEVSFEVAGFSGFFVKTSEAPLPVRWISLSARRNDASQVVLDWRVDERAVSRYQVERSLNARDFVPAGTLTARGDGTTEYTFTDPTPVLQRAYYRIRQTDLDGSYSYSRMLSIAGIEEIGLTAFPNPASGIVTVQMEQRHIGSRLKLVNKSGIVVGEIMVKGQTITLDLSKYAPGVYLLSTADGRVMKLVRQ